MYPLPSLAGLGDLPFGVEGIDDKEGSSLVGVSTFLGVEGVGGADGGEACICEMRCESLVVPERDRVVIVIVLVVEGIADVETGFLFFVSMESFWESLVGIRAWDCAGAGDEGTGFAVAGLFVSDWVDLLELRLRRHSRLGLRRLVFGFGGTAVSTNGPLSRMGVDSSELSGNAEIAGFLWAS